MFRKFNSAKRILALLLGVLCLLSFFGCGDSGYIDTDIDYNENSDESDCFADIEPYTEYSDNASLSNAIDAIMAVDIPMHNDFKDFDIMTVVRNELASVSPYWPIAHNTDSVDYEWLENGEINADLLTEKFRQNTMDNGVRLTNDIKMCIDRTVTAIIKDIEYINANCPDFDYACAYKKIDTMYFDLTDDDSCLAYFALGDPCQVCYNLSALDELSDNDFWNTCYHEMMHMFIWCNHDGIVTSGAEINNTDNFSSALGMRLMSEYTVSYVAYTMAPNYGNESFIENKFVGYWALATNAAEADMVKAFIECDPEFYINCFEPELRNVDFFFSVLYGIDLWGGYAPEDMENVNDEEQFKEDCYHYTMLNLLKNAYIRILKEYEAGNLTAEQAIDMANNVYFAGHEYTVAFAYDFGKLSEKAIYVYEEKNTEMREILDDYIASSSN